jgi:Xaa-Pro dipeptidase
MGVKGRMFDFKGRVRRLQAKLAESEVDGAVLFRPEHIYYFGGFWGYWPHRYIGFVVPTSGRPTLVCPALEQAYARASTSLDDIRVYVEWESPDAQQDCFQVVCDLIREKGLTRGTLGIEGSFLPANVYRQFKELIGEDRIADVDEQCLELRAIKEPEEIAVMRQAGEVVLAEIRAALEAARPGAFEYEISLAVKDAGTRKAAELLGQEERLVSPVIGGVQILSAEARRADWVHGRASTHRLESGDAVYMCFCDMANYKGYNLGFDRTAPVGRLSRERRRLLDGVLAAHDAAISAARPGEIAANVDSAANDVLKEAGLLQFRLHRTGRGVGVSPSEGPALKWSDRTVLQSGMTLCIAPGVYVPGLGNAHIGDTVVITDTGCESLTPFPGRLWEAVPET